jgi:hypothetical protein
MVFEMRVEGSLCLSGFPAQRIDGQLVWTVLGKRLGSDVDPVLR